MIKAVVLFLTFSAGVAMATEEPKFTVLSKTTKYEVRQYGVTLVAETTFNAPFDEAGNQAFRILADYIFGNNTTQTKVAMTAPVTLSPSSQKIDMTAPVSQMKSPGGYVVQFTMPEAFTLKTIPVPNDSRVKLKEVPGRQVAVYSYSGSWSESRYAKKLAEFQTALAADGRKTVGEPVFARFNSPFMIQFLRRNEIWIELKN